MNKDLLKKIIKYGTYAPSGDNSQPWKFVITKNNEILLYNLPLKDNPVLNIHQGGSLLSHGAVVCNIKIAADIFGYKGICDYFPNEKDATLIVKISFSENSVDKTTNTYDDRWLGYMQNRNTNRRAYSKNLSEDRLNQLKENLHTKNCEIKLFTNKKDKDFIANEVSLSEEIILQTEELHKLLFKDVVWTQKEELKKRHGLFVKTLEFNPIQHFIFWLCRKWKNMSFLNKIGFAHFVATQNAKIYKASGILGFINIFNTDRLSYVYAGETMQHLWLKTESLGLSFQPVTGLFFLRERIRSIEKDPILSKNKIDRICKSYQSIENFINLPKDQSILISFRIGEASKASARSSRLEPNIIIE